MSAEENKALIHRFVEECVNMGDAALLDMFVAADVVMHTPGPEQAPGIDGIRQAFAWFQTVFPNLHITLEDMLAEGDKVVSRWTAQGTHQGELQGLPPTGKQATWTGIDIYRITNGKIVDWWRSADILGLLQQLGAMPTSEQAAREATT